MHQHPSTCGSCVTAFSQALTAHNALHGRDYQWTSGNWIRGRTNNLIIEMTCMMNGRHYSTVAIGLYYLFTSYIILWAQVNCITVKVNEGNYCISPACDTTLSCVSCMFVMSQPQWQNSSPVCCWRWTWWDSGLPTWVYKSADWSGKGNKEGGEEC